MVTDALKILPAEKEVGTERNVARIRHHQDAEIVPMTVTMGVADKESGRLSTREVTLGADEGIRAALDHLARRPASTAWRRRWLWRHNHPRPQTLLSLNHDALTRQGYRESRHNSPSLGLPGTYCVSPPLGALDRFASIAVPECVTEISVAKMFNATRRSQLKFCNEPN